MLIFIHKGIFPKEMDNMKKLILALLAAVGAFSLASCQGEEKQPDYRDDSETLEGGKFGTDEPNASIFSFRAEELPLPEEDYDYLLTGTYGTNNYYTMGGDIRIRINSEQTKVKTIELEKNKLGWIKFKVAETSTITVLCSSTSNANTSRLVIVNEDKVLQRLSSYLPAVSLINDNTQANITGSDLSTITCVVKPGTYTLYSPAISDKEDVAYRKNLKIASILVSPGADDSTKVLLNADTLKLGTYKTNIALFSGAWGSINATANDSKDSSGKDNGQIVIDENKKSYDNIDFTTRIKTGGAMADDASKRAVIITINQRTVFSMYALSSNKQLSRTVEIYDSSKTNSVLEEPLTVSGADFKSYSFTLEKGTYYLTSTSGGLNIYGFLLTY